MSALELIRPGVAWLLGPWTPPWPPGVEQPLVLPELRALLTGDPRDASADPALRELVLRVVEERLRRGLPAVVVAPAWPGKAFRDQLLARAKAFHAPLQVLGLEPGAPDPELARELDELSRRRAVREVHRLERPPRELRWAPPPCDRRELAGPFDLIGDLHGCLDELLLLLDRLGWRESGGRWSHPGGRTLVFLGDLVDRGPRIVEALRLVMDLVAQGVALCVIGNHDDKLRRWLEGKKKVRPAHGLERTLVGIEALPAPERELLSARALTFIRGLPDHLVLDGGRLVAVHGGLRAEMVGRTSGELRAFALYGDTTGEVDAMGLPVRRDWAAGYSGAARIVYGHTPVPRAEWVNGTIDIDQGCVFGGALTALRWPEQDLVQVQALAVHWPGRPTPPDSPDPGGADVDSRPEPEGAE